MLSFNTGIFSKTVLKLHLNFKIINQSVLLVRWSTIKWTLLEFDQRPSIGIWLESRHWDLTGEPALRFDQRANVGRQKNKFGLLQTTVFRFNKYLSKVNFSIKTKNHVFHVTLVDFAVSTADRSYCIKQGCHTLIKTKFPVFSLCSCHFPCVFLSIKNKILKSVNGLHHPYSHPFLPFFTNCYILKWH